MRDLEPDRLRQAISRLVAAQQEALDAANQALETGGVDLEDDAQLVEMCEHLGAALEDVRAILEGALEDVQDVLKSDGGA